MLLSEISGPHDDYEHVSWDVAPCSLVETDRRLREITASIIMATKCTDNLLCTECNLDAIKF
jgi:hypothetical protein